MAQEIGQDEWLKTVKHQHSDCVVLNFNVADDAQKRAANKVDEMVKFLEDDQFEGVFYYVLYAMSYEFDRFTAVNAIFSITDPRTAMAFKMRWL